MKENYLSQLLSIAKEINILRNVHETISIILKRSVETIGAQHGILLVCTPEEDIIAAAGYGKEDVLAFSRNVLKYVKEYKEALLTDDMQEDNTFKIYESVRNFKIRSLYCLPLLYNNELIGILYLDHCVKTGLFGKLEQLFIQAFSELATIALQNALRYSTKVKETERLLTQAEGFLQYHYNIDRLIGKSKPMLDLKEKILALAQTDVPVLIQGETGTGKEQIARLIHYLGERHKSIFYPLDCASIPEGLIESELFGIESKIATGVDKHTGAFEAAEGGSLFLDEIGELPPNQQVKLLRVLQEKVIYRVGSRKPISINARIIAATNKDLSKEVASDRFRQDLYYRLNVGQINVPSLRERLDDLPFLTSHFLTEFEKTERIQHKQISKDALDKLMEYDYPGNIRELRCILLRAAVFSKGSIIMTSDLEMDNKPLSLFSLKCPMTMQNIKISAIKETLKLCNGNITLAAKQLDIDRSTLHRILNGNKE